MVDTHAHLNFKDFNEDYKQVIKDSIDNGVETIINIGSDFQTSEKALKIAEEYKICFAGVSVHPIHTDRAKGMARGEIQEKLEHLARAKKVVAIGETGLDYYHLPAEQEKRGKVTRAQKQLFQIHLDLARKTKLPLILHCRDAYEDLLQIINETVKQWNNETMRGVVHCFCGDLETAQRFLDLGFYLGFTGMVTYPGNEDLSQVIREIPLEKILVETDCPYLPPQVKRGERNLPYYVRYVIEYITQVKGLKFEEVERKTAENAAKLFQLR